MRNLAFALVLLAACESDPEHSRVQAQASYATSIADVIGGDTTASDTGASDTGQTGVTDTGASDSDVTDTGVTSPTDTGVTDTSPTDTGTADTTTPDTVTPGEPWIDVPETLAIPWVRAGAGASTLAVSLANLGDAGPISITLSGDASLSLSGAPTSVAAGGDAELTLRFAGNASATVAEGRLTVTAGGETRYAEVFAMAGADLPAPSWTPVTQGTLVYGRSATVHLSTAPFPDASGSWTDDRVDVFVPDGFRDRGPVDFVVHFHGFGTTIASTLSAHKYREQLWASGANAILVTPQGPVNASSGNFGKLMDAGGLAALLRDVVAILYKDGTALTPRSGDVTLTEHSGGYQAVAANLEATTDRGQVMTACLFDGLYARSSDFIDFVDAGGWFRSDYTLNGGTRTLNLAIVDDLSGRVEETKTAEHLLNADSVVWFTPAQHNDAMTWQQAYAETLRWASPRARRGPRVELRSAIAVDGSATLRWLAPRDEGLVGFIIETSDDGAHWSEAARPGPTATSATLAWSGGRYVRVRSRVSGLDDDETWASDVYWVEDDADVLVVDGFDRIFGGSYSDIRQGFAGRVGQAIHAAAASNEAISEDGLDLSDFRAVVWLVGDESLADQTFDEVERAYVDAYVAGGGGIVVSGSEVGFELKTTAASFLSGLGATYAADDANQLSAKGAGALSSVASFAFGGAAAPYPEDYPDVLAAANGASVILQYGNGMTAAVGRAGASAVVGFPLETIEVPADLASVVNALVAFVSP